jgi:MFS family permease
VPRRRWGIAWLLGLGVLVNYFDRVNLSVSHAALYTAFGISNITFGYLSGAYNWTYAMCQLPVGVLLDRFGVRRVGRISTLLWSVASFAAAMTPGIHGFFAARLVLGVGEAPTFPANAKAIGLWFPSRERSFATAIFDAAAKFASAIGIPVIGVLLLKFGWRWSFAITGLVSLLYFALFSKIYRDPDEDPALSELSGNTSSRTRISPPPKIRSRQRRRWDICCDSGKSWGWRLASGPITMSSISYSHGFPAISRPRSTSTCCTPFSIPACLGSSRRSAIWRQD